MEKPDIGSYLNSGKHCHLVGIGGVSMSPLAEILYLRGIPVSGSDISDSEVVYRLRDLGITDIAIGHDASNVIGADYIIRTAAAQEDNAEIKQARASGIPVYERAEAWGHIMRDYKNAICISGAHGKTSTTSMVTQILMTADVDPTVMIGGTLPLLGSGYRVGRGDTIVLESCEYYNSFHNFFPTVAVVLNVDADHLDFFKDLEDVKASFRTFAAITPEDGYIVCNADDANTMDALAPLGRELFTFGFGTGVRVRAENPVFSSGGSSFTLIKDNIPLCEITLSVPGRHNMQNALASAAATLALGISPELISRGLAAFTGAGRRFEYKGKFKGVPVFDDYAHHPGELHALLDMTDSLNYKRVIIAFQPHTYTRTHALFDDFQRELSRPDILLLAEIYAAREKNTIGISSKDLADKIPGSFYYADFRELAEKIAEIAAPGDLIVTVGAGDIHKVGEILLGL